MEAKRVIVENLPKPKRWEQENAGIIIALLAVLVSLYSLRLAQKEFIAAPTGHMCLRVPDA